MVTCCPKNDMTIILKFDLCARMVMDVPIRHWQGISGLHYHYYFLWAFTSLWIDDWPVLPHELLVSTYVVCEILPVMHEPAGVVEILVQILRNTPILNLVPPPTENWNLGRSWHFKTFQFWLQNTHPPPPTPPPKIQI